MGGSALTLRAESLERSFLTRRVLQGITLKVGNGDCLALTGRNGSGKTTAMKILAGLLAPSAGSVHLAIDGREQHAAHWFRHIGYVAPYLNLYEEFTAWEHLELAARLRAADFNAAYAAELLDRFGMAGRRFDTIRTFSSGMKQRIKYAVALLHRPPLLFLDEPMTNLDSAGIACIESLIAEQYTTGGAVILASNDARDIALCARSISVEPADTNTHSH